MVLEVPQKHINAGNSTYIQSLRMASTFS